MPWDSRASVHEFQPRSSFAVTLENLGWPLGRWQHPKQQWQVVPASAKARQRLCKGFAATADFTARTLSHGHATGLGRFVVASRRWSDCQAQPDLRLSGLRRPGIARRLHALRFQLLHEIVPALPRTDTHTHTQTQTQRNIDHLSTELLTRCHRGQSRFCCSSEEARQAASVKLSRAPWEERI